jgi:predicted DCC family thiol-disulfide oxidoreductase YuxK
MSVPALVRRVGAVLPIDTGVHAATWPASGTASAPRKAAGHPQHHYQHLALNRWRWTGSKDFLSKGRQV